jgi:choline dehydrogenase-like flavoprotein
MRAPSSVNRLFDLIIIGSGAAGGGAAEGLKAAAGTWLRARQQVEEHE